MEDILKSIKSFLYERNTSPLFGSYLISSIALNYNFFIILFSDSKPQVKISLIEQILNQSVHVFSILEIQSKYLTLFIYPVFLSIFYIFVYPLLAEPVFEYSLKKQTALRRIRQKIEDTKQLSIEESREIRLRLAKITDEYNNEINHYQNQIRALNQRIEELERLEASESLEQNADINDINNSLFQSAYSDVLNKMDKLIDGEYSIDNLIETQQRLNYMQKEELGNIIISNIKNKQLHKFRYNESNNKIIKSSLFEPYLITDEEKVLKCFIKQDTALLNEITKNTNLKISKVKAILSSLINKNYIEKMATKTLADLDNKYAILNDGTKYLSENGYFD